MRRVFHPVNSRGLSPLAWKSTGYERGNNASGIERQRERTRGPRQDRHRVEWWSALDHEHRSYELDETGIIMHTCVCGEREKKRDAARGSGQKWNDSGRASCPSSFICRPLDATKHWSRNKNRYRFVKKKRMTLLLTIQILGVIRSDLQNIMRYLKKYLSDSFGNLIRLLIASEREKETCVLRRAASID